MKYIVLLILLFPCIAKAQKKILATDTCISITFKENIYAPGYIQINQLKQLPDGEYIIAGIYRYSQASSVNRAFIGKLSESGDLLWYKTFGYDPDGYESYFTNLAITSDNNIFVVASSGDYPGENHLIIKFDYDGNVIWKYKYDFGSGGIGPIRPTDDGGIYFSGSNSNNGIFIGKINSSGSLQWANYYGAGSGYMNAENITEYGNSLYVVGIGLINGNSGTTTYIAKVNKYTGDLLWAETFGLVRTNDFDLAFTDVQESNGNLLVTGLTSRFNLPSLSPALFTFDTSGTFLNAVCYQLPGRNIPSDNPFMYDDHLKFAAYTPSVDSNDIVFFNPGANGLRTFTWTAPGDQVLHTMSNCADSGFIVSLLSFGYDSPGDWTKALIIKNNNQAVDLNCNYQNINCNTTNFTITGEPLPLIVDPISFSNTNSSIHEIAGGQLTVEKICSSLKTCTLGQLSGPDSLCTGQTVIYHTGTNGDCGNALFAIDTSFAAILSSSDNQATLYFKRPGTVNLYASLTTGCGIQKDSVVIHVFPTSDLLDLGPDTGICPDNTLQLAAGAGYTTYLWQDGSTDSLFTVHLPGTYYVSVSDFCGNSSSDTIIISAAIPVPFALGPDITKCNHDSVTITATPGFSHYNWGPAYNISALTGQSVIVFPDTDTLYKVVAEKTPGCFSIDSIHVHVNHSPIIDLGVDTSFCEGDSLLLNAGDGFITYQWNTGSGNNFLVVRNAGTYRVTGTAANGCKSVDAISIIDVYHKPGINLPKSATICEGADQSLIAGTGFSDYLWNTGSHANSLIVTTPGIYWLQVTDNNNCVGRDSVVVSLGQCHGGFFIPEAFTPNDDGKNDRFYPLLSGQVINYRFCIFNRWGQKVFETTELQKGWDGSIAGKKANTNVFAWVCTYQFEGQPVETRKGVVALIR